jgi:hypothetical protein
MMMGNSANVERIKKLSEELVEHGNELKLLEEENTELKARVAELEAAAQARPKGPNDSLNESVFGEEMANRLNTILEQEATIAAMRKQMASMAGEKTAAEKQVEQLQAQVKQVTDAAASEVQELKAAHAQELEHVRARAKDTLQLSRSQMQSEIDALRMRPPNVTSKQEAMAQTDSSSLTMTNSDHMQKGLGVSTKNKKKKKQEEKKEQEPKKTPTAQKRQMAKDEFCFFPFSYFFFLFPFPPFFSFFLFSFFFFLFSFLGDGVRRARGADRVARADEPGE